MIQSFPRRMAVPMAERLTMVRLCLRPAPRRRPPTRRHFCRDRLSLVRILRHLSSGLKSRRARQRGTSLTFIIYDRYFSQARARTPGSASERKVAATGTRHRALLIAVDASAEAAKEGLRKIARLCRTSRASTRRGADLSAASYRRRLLPRPFPRRRKRIAMDVIIRIAISAARDSLCRSTTFNRGIPPCSKKKKKRNVTSRY